jgi:TRAP-type C4-dicarboxylate transport system substrate-binding protein
MLGAGSSLYGMRQQVWDSLSADEKAAFEKAGAKAQQHLCSYLDRMDEEDIAWMTKNTGFKATRLSKEENARWNARVVSIADAWAKEMDSTGRPGTALLKAFREAPAK